MGTAFSPLVSRWLLAAAELESHALAHFCLWLAADATARGQLDVSPGQIARRRGLTYEKVRSNLALLVKLGLLDPVQSASRTRPARYALRLPQV
jgi:hypothetical protein